MGVCLGRCFLESIGAIPKNRATPCHERCAFHRAVSAGNTPILCGIRAITRSWGGARAPIKGIASLALWLRAIPKIIAFRAGIGAKKPRSVLHISYISHKQYMLSRLLRTHGIQSSYLAINTSDNDQLMLGYDYAIPANISRLRRLWMGIRLFWGAVARYDVIHYHFNAFLVGSSGLELPVLKAMGKVVVFHFRGCDLRSRSINVAKHPAFNLCQECDYPIGSCDTDYQRERLAIVRRYGDIFFVTTPDMRDFFPEAEHMPFIAPYGIDMDAIAPAPRTPGVFRVVTSSSHPGLDGVHHIRMAIDRLRAEDMPVELVEVFQLPYRQALAIYKSADLFCGKLRMGYYNNANIETMIFGVPNMSYIRDEFRSQIPDLPIIVARPDTVYEKLKEALSDPQALAERGRRGPEFIRRHHDPDAVIEQMLDRYETAWKTKRGIA